MGIVFCIIVFILLKRDYEKSSKLKINNGLTYTYKKYLMYTIGASILLLIMIIFYDKVTWLAYSWMLLSVLIIVIVQYIRLFYTGYNIIKRKK